MKLFLITIIALLPFSVGDMMLDISEYDSTRTVTATCYNATVEQCDSTPLITAFGYKIDPSYPKRQRFLAISRDLEQYYSKGDTVIIDGTGVYDGHWMIADRMNRRWERKIDFLVSSDDHIAKFNDIIIRKK